MVWRVLRQQRRATSRVYSLEESKAKRQSRPGQEAPVLSHGTVLRVVALEGYWSDADVG